jgi:polyphosphate:AMP phosphotransferase
MFEAAELGRKVAKGDYREQLPELRAGLLQAQLELRKAGVPVIVVLSGAEGAGKSETVQRLHEWLDPRGIETNVFGPLSDEERERPPYWRFWRTLPARGRIGLFFGSWYTDPLVKHAYGESRTSDLERQAGRIAFFEQMLVDDGALLLKFWLHLSKKAQRKRFESLEGSPETSWRVSPLEWKHYKHYGRFVKASELCLRWTDSARAPWFIVEASDERYRELMVGRILLEAMRRRLESGGDGATGPAAHLPSRIPAPPPTPEASLTVLDHVDLEKRLDDDAYARKLLKLQARLSRLTRAAADKKRSSVIVFEGWDAAGKGGGIRRLTEAIDARLCRVIPVAAPTDEERAHHYLWRFWRHVPRSGLVTIYDRSWYGRVLVERVEGFAREGEWMRAYLEINDFEQQLVESGVVLTKFWVHVSPEEQLRRFEDRQRTAYKQHKITEEDWRNREKWEAYRAAVNDMVVRTSTRKALWTLVAGNDKKFARIQMLETVCRRLERAL